MILGINRSLLDNPKSKRHQQKLKQFKNQAVKVHSQTYTSIRQKNDLKCISKITFDFNSINSRLNDKIDVQRIHAKQGTKRVGGKVIFENGQQKQSIKHKKHHSYLNLRMSELANTENKDELGGASQNTLLNIKSYRSSQQSQDDKEAVARSIRNDERQSSIPVEMISMSESNNALLHNILQNMKEKQKEQSIQNSQRNMCKKYSNMRKPMNSSIVSKNEVIPSHSQIELPKKQLILEGSQKSKHKRPSTPRRNKNNKIKYLSQRSQSPNSSFDLQKPLGSQKKFSSKEQSKCFLNYREMKKIKEDSLKILNSQDKKQKKIRHTSKQNLSQKCYFINNLITFDNSPTLMKYKTQLKQNSKKNRRKDYAKQNQNLHQILSQCENSKNERNPIDKQVMALKYCSQKIASTLQKSKYGLNDTHQF